LVWVTSGSTSSLDDVALGGLEGLLGSGKVAVERLAQRELLREPGVVDLPPPRAGLPRSGSAPHCGSHRSIWYTTPRPPIS
jgi:hypothetical protein